MKKNIFIPLVGCLVLATSCASEDNTEVFISVNSAYQQQLKELRAKYSYPTSLDSQDNYYAPLSDIVNAPKAPITGEYADRKSEGGYVDLGLSVKWATFNLNPKYGNTESFAQLLSEAYQEEQVSPNEYANIQLPDTLKGPFPCVISYEDYCKGCVEYISSQLPQYSINQYAEYCQQMRKAYYSALDQYYGEMMRYWYYHWGDIDYYAVANDYKDMPMDIKGTKYDLATQYLGSDWRMPTKAELQELVDKCKWEVYAVNGHYGYIVTGPSGKRIFIAIGAESDTTSRPSIILSSERTDNWEHGVYVYALDTEQMKMISNFSSGYNATIHPVYTK